MKKSHRQGTVDALNKYYSRMENERLKELGPRRHNEKPEKLVEKECLKWMRVLGWSVNIFEAKATLDESGRWRNTAMKAGVCDCLGNTSEGVSVAIEFKAPGAMSSFNSAARTRQREFILSKIESNCFACVVDSVGRLQSIYEKWIDIRRTDGVGAAKLFLVEQLPKKRVVSTDDEKLFD